MSNPLNTPKKVKKVKGKTTLIPPETYKTYSKNIVMGLSVQWIDQILIISLSAATILICAVAAS